MIRFVCLMCLLCFAHAASAAANAQSTEDVFSRYQDRLVQVRILEASAGAQAGIGTGFFAGDKGLIVTNYHVVSDLIQQPQLYRGEVLTTSGQRAALQLIDFDVVHDLAIVRAQLPARPGFELYPQPLPIGMRLFSIGTPLDLGFTIVEGTYNGLIEASLYEKIHFTGSINPGMSGGPTVLSNGQVIGVNVATAGNQVSFLVPAKFVQTLLSRAQTAKPLSAAQALQHLRDQLHANQDSYMQKLIHHPASTTSLGKYQVPGQMAGFIKCWGDTIPDATRRYTDVAQQCSSEDNLFVSRSMTTGVVQFQHHWLESRGLNRYQFYQAYQEQFNANYPGMQANAEDVGKFSCHTDFVKTNGVRFKAALCLRPHKRLPGLYDAVLKAATLNESQRGVLTTLVLYGISAQNATAFSRRYLESFRWMP